MSCTYDGIRVYATTEMTAEKIFTITIFTEPCAFVLGGERKRYLSCIAEDIRCANKNPHAGDFESLRCECGCGDFCMKQLQQQLCLTAPVNKRKFPFAIYIPHSPTWNPLKCLQLLIRPNCIPCPYVWLHFDGRVPSLLTGEKNVKPCYEYLCVIAFAKAAIYG